MSEHIDTLLTFLRDQGATDIRVEMGGKHPHIYWTWRGEAQKYITAGSLSDWRGTNNALSDLRHKLGIIKTVKRVGERRERRERICRAETAPPALTALGDPFAALRRHRQFEGRWKR